MTRVTFSHVSPARAAVDLLLLPVFEDGDAGDDVRSIGEALGADLHSVMDGNGVRPQLGSTCLIPTLGRIPATAVLLLGLGRRAELDGLGLRRAIMKAAPELSRYQRVATTLHTSVTNDGVDVDAAVHAAAEAVALAGYRYPADRSAAAHPQTLTFLDGARRSRSTSRAAEHGRVHADAANRARELVDAPAGEATPEEVAARLKRMAAEVGVRCSVLAVPELRRRGFGAILGVGASSVNQPRLVVLRYEGGGRAPLVGIAGKGITFDAGGLMLKDAAELPDMKFDMAGGAAVAAAVRAAAELRLPVNLVAAIPLAENLPSATAIHPGDVIRHSNGTTTEVWDTDGEGRLVLADALAFLAAQGPAAIVDLATLTSAAEHALGLDLWAVIGNDDGLVRSLLKAGEQEGEPGWQLPLWAGYREHLVSRVADRRNTGASYREGGAILGALFLREFVGDIPWAHIDMAGPTWADHRGGLTEWPRGATGSPARTIMRWLEGWGDRS